MALGSKINRYKSLIGKFRNWPQFLFFKMGKKGSFNFKMRNGFELSVSRQMLPPFKESFFDGVYFQGFPKEKLPKGKIQVIDVGANVGFFSLYMFSEYPEASILSFEPMPFNYNQLKNYQSSYPAYNWHIEQKALADHREGLKLHSSTVEGFSTMASVFEADGKGEVINVPTMTLADVVGSHKFEKIDLIKLDCEGSEYAILYSAPRELLDTIELMCIETHAGKNENENHQSMVRFISDLGMSFKEKTNADGTGYIWAWR